MFDCYSDSPKEAYILISNFYANKMEMILGDEDILCLIFIHL